MSRSYRAGTVLLSRLSQSCLRRMHARQTRRFGSCKRRTQARLGSTRVPPPYIGAQEIVTALPTFHRITCRKRGGLLTSRMQEREVRANNTRCILHSHIILPFVGGRSILLLGEAGSRQQASLGCPLPSATLTQVYVAYHMLTACVPIGGIWC